MGTRSTGISGDAEEHLDSQQHAVGPQAHHTSGRSACGLILSLEPRSVGVTVMEKQPGVTSGRNAMLMILKDGSPGPD